VEVNLGFASCEYSYFILIIKHDESEHREPTKVRRNSDADKVLPPAQSRNANRSACATASRGALLFFLMMDLSKMHTFYKYSLDAFVMVVTRAVTSVTLRGIRCIEPENILVEALLRNALSFFTSASLAAQSKFAPPPMMCGDHHRYFKGVVFGIELDGVE